MMCLLIGPSGVGKTLLLKRLSSVEDEIPSTVSTVGTNLVTISIGRRKEVVVRELGGSMGPIWNDYFSDVSSIVYMVDISNLEQVAAATMQFIELLNHTKTQSTKILLLFNKLDLVSEAEKMKFLHLFMLDEILHHAVQEIEVHEISAVKKTGFSSVKDWLEVIAAS